jgi:hypothetical protein
MTAFDPTVAARIAASGIPMSADYAPNAAEVQLAQYGQRTTSFECDAERTMYRLACDLRGELERLRGQLSDQRAYEVRLREQHDLDVAVINRMRAERDALRDRLHQIALAKVWTNEDGKRFVFADDLAQAAFGIEPNGGAS